jgi:NADP-dependent 3-hydroxy acid dehydrogenase YdfG
MTDRPVAVVTGASSGIGGATARALARSGFAVVLGGCGRRRVAVDVPDERTHRRAN